MFVVPLSPFAYLMLGLAFTGLGCWMALTALITFLAVFGGLFLLMGVGSLAVCAWLRRSGVDWFQTRF
ncbi:hypothetical protein GCM10009678_80420 [Actinomadura kijaniata]|uniref:FtsH-binding integral membrane protein n=1 Tax=Actinomadura namibiensis TaxID=182080 RepID=A0A7W3QRW6_ACTNM|nr:hypothetical protein [Actinomadura namibiensis]MBA8956788.1 FtsH-binding integral membrane protein [Actinomadura namibiensis]